MAGVAGSSPAATTRYEARGKPRAFVCPARSARLRRSAGRLEALEPRPSTKPAAFAEPGRRSGDRPRGRRLGGRDLPAVEPGAGRVGIDPVVRHARAPLAEMLP